jgi:hypothetical protein
MTERQTVNEKSSRSDSHRVVVEAVRNAETFAVTLPGIGMKSGIKSIGIAR